MKLFQISEDDLAKLEQLLPEIHGCIIEKMNDTSLRMKFRQVKNVLLDVRWVMALFLTWS